MFKMNLSAPQPLRVARSMQPTPSPEIVSLGSRGASRAPSQMYMNIANLRTSRGCNSCGK